MIVGGDWGPGDNGSSSSGSGFLLGITLPHFAGFFRNEKRKNMAMDKERAAIPPTTAVSEMVNMRSREDDTRKSCSPPMMAPVFFAAVGVGSVKPDDVASDGDELKPFGFSAG